MSSPELPAEPYPNEHGYMGPVNEHEQLVPYDAEFAAKQIGSLALGEVSESDLVVVPEAEPNWQYGRKSDEAASTEVAIRVKNESEDGEPQDQQQKKWWEKEAEDIDFEGMDRREAQFRAREAANRARKLGEFMAPDPESHPGSLLSNVATIQNEMTQLKYWLKNDGGSGDSVYHDRLVRNTERFMDNLLSEELNPYMEHITLGPEAFDMIDFYLSDRFGKAPAPETLSRLKEIVDSQQMESIEFPDRPDAPARYLSLKNEGIFYGPYDRPEDDSVGRVLKKVRPESWKLTDEQRSEYRGYLQQDDLEVSQYRHKPVRSVDDVRGKIGQARDNAATKPHRIAWPLSLLKPRPKPGQTAPFRDQRPFMARLRNDQWNIPEDQPEEVQAPVPEPAQQPVYKQEVMSWWQKTALAQTHQGKEVKDPRVAQKAHRDYYRGLLELDEAARRQESENDNSGSTETSVRNRSKV